MGNDGLAASPTNAKVGRDAFSYSLNYFAGDYAAIEATKWSSVANRFEAGRTNSYLFNARNDLYNGNISAMVTNMAQPKLYTSAANEQPTLQPQGMAYKYDQLNRIKNANAYTNLNTTNNEWETTGGVPANYYRNTFTYDGNGNILNQTRYAQTTLIDDLSYKYTRDANQKLLRNQLNYVTDAVVGSTPTDDIESQSLGNYKYDELGNLRKDSIEQIETIEWNVYGKIKKIKRYLTSTKSNLEFVYDPSGNRIAKIEKPDGTSVENGAASDQVGNWKITYYVRDATGNVMGNYYQTTVSGLPSHKLTEHPIYGSSRLGSDNTQLEMIAAVIPSPFTRTIGNKYFEGVNHLGNVLSVYTDKKIPRDDNSDGTVDYYQAEVVSCSDYTAFGAPMNERTAQVVNNPPVLFEDDCSTTSSWTTSNGSTISSVSGRLKVERTTPGTPPVWGVSQSSTYAVTAGKTYTITFDLDMGTCTAYTVYLNYVDPTFVANLLGSYTTSGTYSVSYTPTATGNNFLSLNIGTATAVCGFYLDNIKVTGPPAPVVVTGGQGNYRYGFNGKENDKEVVGTGQGTQDYGMRIYNPSLGKFLSVDPLTRYYPHLTPYQFASNNPILNIDLDGMEGVDYTKNMVLTSSGRPRFAKFDANNTAKNPIYTFMIDNTMYIKHNDKLIQFNPSSAPTSMGIAIIPGYYFALNIKSYSDALKNYTDNHLVGQVTKSTGTADNLARGGFVNTFRHFAWQSLIAMAQGENNAKRAGDYHEADGINNVQGGKFIKDNVIDLINNQYAREYSKDFNFAEVVKSPESFADYMNGLVQHITSTVDGYKDDKQFEEIRNGSTKLFDAKDENFQKVYESAKNLDSAGGQ